MAKEHYVYKYVYNGQVIYIGLTDNDLTTRIRRHAQEDEFKPYLSVCSIYCACLANKSETDIMETALINKYKPFINIQKKYPEPCSLRFEEPQWEPYTSYLARKEQEAGDNYHSKEALKIKRGIAQNNSWISQYEKDLKWEQKRIEKLEAVYQHLTAHDLSLVDIYVDPQVYPTKETAEASSSALMPIISFSHNRGWLLHLLFSEHEIKKCSNGFCVIHHFTREELDDYDDHGNRMRNKKISAVQFFVKHYPKIHSEYEERISQLNKKLENSHAVLQDYLAREKSLHNSTGI